MADKTVQMTESGVRRIVKKTAENASGIKEMMKLIGAVHAENWKDVSEITSRGMANKAFSIGEQLAEEWTDVTSSASAVYSAPMNIVHFSDNEKDENGKTLKGMFMQWAYTTPEILTTFDEREALYTVPEGGMPAGAYYFKFVSIPSIFGAQRFNDHYCSFTLPSALQEGNQLVLNMSDNARDMSYIKVAIYTDCRAGKASASINVTEAQNGEYLGETDGNGDLNDISRAIYGYNRWSQSSIRQWLNSDAEAGAWWTPQNKWDRGYHTNIPGFLHGYSKEFINALKTIKVTTRYLENGVEKFDTTYDRVFLPALNQMHVSTGNTAEGETWRFYSNKNMNSWSFRTVDNPTKSQSLFTALRSIAFNGSGATGDNYYCISGYYQSAVYAYVFNLGIQYMKCHRVDHYTPCFFI